VIAEGAAIGVMRSDAQVGLVVEQAIDETRRWLRRKAGSQRSAWRQSADAVRS
jgi:hypothetical protein